MPPLTVLHFEAGFDGPGWYVLDEGTPVWGPYDSRSDAAWAKRIHERDLCGPARRINGYTVWIVDADAAASDEYRPAERRGYLVMVDDEDIGPYHPTFQDADRYLQEIVADIQQHPDVWPVRPGLATRPEKRMAPTMPPDRVLPAQRKSS